MRSGICLAGRAGSGKSPLAEHLASALNERGYSSLTLSFADAIKQEVWELYGVKKGDKGSRDLLISHGDQRVSLDPTYWIRRLIPMIETAWFQGHIPIVDDVRREPEYTRLTHHDFFRVKVVASRTLRRKALEKAGLDPEFADSNNPTERHHEVWTYDHRAVLFHTPENFRSTATSIVTHAIASSHLPKLSEVLNYQAKRHAA